MKPAVSVIFPVYGVEDYIENCLRSVAGQTFRDMELILVDDESRDGSISVAEKFLEKTDLEWRVIRQKNAGQGAARDYGIREARGKYVVCIDADDMVSPIFLECMYKEAESGEYDAVFTGFRSAKSGDPFYMGPVTFQPINREELLYQFLCRTLIPILPAMLIRREIILEYDLRAKDGCRFSEDVYFMWLLFSRAKDIAYTQAPLYHYLRRPNSTMTASSAARIITGYEAFYTLSQDPNFTGDFQGVSYLLPRWVLGSLRTAAGISSYPVFYELAQKMDYRTHAQALQGFPERKARILAICLRISPRVFYNVVKRLG
ncbi:glycosyltransferase family 2 protein [Lawsonibacter sp. LCP25S3_G6]|uniref:glycosyltransferase family 2 protein n=1 Tax=unclassified Lawsonibacter TaxID=2617946 RepID=UPI003F95E271